VESSSDAIVSTTLDGIITSWNAGAMVMYGYTAEEIIGQGVWLLVPPDLTAELVPVLDQIRRGGRAVLYETKRMRKDGTIIDVLVSISPIRDDSGAIAGVAAVSRDITERNRAQAQREQTADRRHEAERMESLSRLAGAVGNSFGASLDTILSCADALAEVTADNSALHADVRYIQAVAESAARLAGELLVFSGRDPAPPGLADLNAVLIRTRELLQVVIGGHSELRLLTTPGLPVVTVDAAQIEQLLLNLAFNASDAMPSGGTLTFTTRLADLSEEQDAERAGARPGQYVQLRVSDTGCGMDPETMRHVFDPFFTTKQPGQGGGLGLSTAYGIVTKAGGAITVGSEEGIGTTFHIWLPTARIPAPAQPVRLPLVAPGHGEIILVVDGKPAALEITARILQRSGYQTLEASTSEEALSLMSSHDIRLLLADAESPGSALLDRALEMKPGVPVLCMSSPGFGASGPDPAAGPRTPRIGKPFTALDLLEKVHAVLTATPTEF
jgi:PAS domain S-box-containing protein